MSLPGLKCLQRLPKTGFSTLAIFFMTCALALGLAACAPEQQRRSMGTILDDQTLETRAIDRVYSQKQFDDDDHIKVEVHNGTLLLAGETKSEENKALATRLTSEIKGIERVVNELAVQPRAGAGDRLDNAYITSKVNTYLTTINPVAGADATRIKVITARRIVYLMGTVTRAEADAVAEVVRNVRGVEKVVKVFDYTD